MHCYTFRHSQAMIKDQKSELNSTELDEMLPWKHQKLISSNRNEIEEDEFNCESGTEETNREATCRFLVFPNEAKHKQIE